VEILYYHAKIAAHRHAARVFFSHCAYDLLQSQARFRGKHLQPVARKVWLKHTCVPVAAAEAKQ
jgi:hypothetical protein